MSSQPAYLEPYARAVEEHGPEFPALLWASPRTQAKRFDAMLSLQNPRGLTVLDLGCGRADLLDHMIRRRVRPARYVGIEGLRELAQAARDKAIAGSEIIVADFVGDPAQMRVGADVIYCSGALNTIEDNEFWRVLRNGFDAARLALVFNFLASPLLAAATFLRWRDRRDMLRFARSLSSDVGSREGYLAGDCTILMRKARACA